jgi:hypothetical protein
LDPVPPPYALGYVDIETERQIRSQRRETLPLIEDVVVGASTFSYCIGYIKINEVGERPSNPKLLDYLASEFMANGWSIKKLHRTIMLSSTYQQSSAYQEAAAANDPQDKLMWRFERRRLEGEVIRDSMLFVSGALNLKMAGPGIFPPLPPGVSQPRSQYMNWKPEKDQAEANRRSVYVFVKRNLRYPMFEAFDFPDTHESCPRRNATVTPTQPLTLMNDELVMEWSRVLAGRVLNDAGLSPEQNLGRNRRGEVHARRRPDGWDPPERPPLDHLRARRGALSGAARG